MRNLFRIGLVLSILVWPGAVYAAAVPELLLGDQPRQSLSEHLAVFRHHDKPLTLAQAKAIHQNQGFQPPSVQDKPYTNFGLTQDEIWLRLEFSTAAELPRQWLLEVAHGSLDRVDVYLAREGQSFSHQHSGDLIPFNKKPFQHRHHVFEWDLEPGSHYTLYLRVLSEGTLTVPVTLWQPEALWQQDQISYSLLSVYYGLLLALFTYNLLLYFSMRDPLYLIYVAFLSMLGIGQAGLAGFSGQFLWADNATLAHLSPTAGVSAAGIFGTLFVKRFLGDLPRRLGLGWFIPLFGAAYAVTLLWVLFGSYHFATISVNIISLVFSAGALILGAISLYYRQPGARFFVLAWAALLTGVIVISLHNLGFLASNALTSNALLIGSALEMLLLSLALADRIHSIQNEHDLAQQHALEMRQEMVQTLQESERHLELRVTERTLELEQTNKQLQESQKLLQHQANHDALTGLVNRKMLNDRLTQAMSRAHREAKQFALVVADLDKFKSINDEWGHQAGDKVLVEVARRLRESVRDLDTIARVGGDEFVLLLESVQSHADAERVCNKLLEIISQPIRLTSGGSVQISLSLGFALYPTDTHDPAALFTLADRSMYRNKGTSTLSM